MKTTQLTQEGFDKLQAELKELKGVKSPAAVARLGSARAMGDLSENSEYVAAKDDLAFIHGRITEIEEILKNVEVVQNHSHSKTVTLGSTVVIESGGSSQTFQIVGEFEADPINKKISPTSPIGNALMNKKVGENVEVTAPAGKVVYKIIDIK